MEPITRSLLQLWWLVHPPVRRDDRGDVPGWVMVTVMTAGVVALLTGILRPELSGMLRNALNSVK
ncbi:hypothetical protein HNR19_001033 [Nocardioides thalensis]|uniref:Uncharacterized protein n=1 Tax=Nocardioides thalensis TaxID=1914755 RepID=A0A853BYQ1_9ACTN|nr:hypothetical protein [Nocardioides thalensis]NYJ00335.1 hypothetical protein [Nocardioides thalensis]